MLLALESLEVLAVVDHILIKLEDWDNSQHQLLVVLEIVVVRVLKQMEALGAIGVAVAVEQLPLAQMV
jgi:hypothetical protein